ncbi:MAG: hypothetical protein M0T77_00730 [Actinomycetota bacterium]|nr:hypothetical protein [Actinomycetota bacterium]
MLADHLQMPSLTQVVKLDVEPAASPEAPATLGLERQAEYV